jgi:hypothetical protein
MMRKYPYLPKFFWRHDTREGVFIEFFVSSFLLPLPPRTSSHPGLPFRPSLRSERISISPDPDERTFPIIVIVGIDLSVQRERFGLIEEDSHSCGLFRKGVHHVDVHDLFYRGEEEFGRGGVVPRGDRAINRL